MLLILSILLTGCSESKVWGSLLFHTAPDGMTLSGTYLPARGPERMAAFVLLHQPGQPRNRNDFDELWYGLADQGVALLAPDLRGHGASGEVGDINALRLDPAGYPVDLRSWLDFLQHRAADGDFIDPDRIAIIGLSGAASLAAAAVGAGAAHCAVAVSPRLDEVNALGAGLLADASGDDDDSAAGGAEAEQGPTDRVHPLLQLRDIRWVYALQDQPSASDVPLLSASTAAGNDPFSVPGEIHGVEIIWRSNEAREAILAWCLERL